MLPTDIVKSGVTGQWLPLHAFLNAPPLPVQPVVSIRGNLLSWPFHQHAWFESLWMTLLWWIPVFGPCLGLGWSVDAARRHSAQAVDSLPRPESFGRILLDGLTVALFFSLYILIPVTLAWIATSLSALSLVFPAAEWIWHYLRGEAVANVQDVLTRIFIHYIEQRAMILVYLILAWPLFTAAGVRFVLTRQAMSFFQLPACLSLLFEHFGAILKFLVLSALVAIGVAVTDILVAPTGIGVPLTIPLGAAGIWAMTWLFANLAAKVQPSLQPEMNFHQTVRVGGAGGPM
jgi:hypothetical protein